MWNKFFKSKAANSGLLLKSVVFLMLSAFAIVYIADDSPQSQKQPAISFSSPAVYSVNLFESAAGKSAPLDEEEHHSQPTLMSVQGKVTDKNGNAISSGNMQVKISKTSSCTSETVYDTTFNSSISSGTFSLTLGEGDTLWTDFNRDYWMCLYVGGELVSGPTKFRSTGGEVNRIGDANSSTYAKFEDTNLVLRQGNFRMDNAKSIMFRNAGNTADVPVVTLNSVGETLIGTQGDSKIINISGGTIYIESAIKFRGTGDLQVFSKGGSAAYLLLDAQTYNPGTSGRKWSFLSGTGGTFSIFDSTAQEERLVVSAGGAVKINALTGSGNGYVCVDSSGNLFRKNSPCA